MIFVSDLIANVQSVIGTTDLTTTYDFLNRAIRLLRNKSSTSNVTWDPSLIYCNIETDPSRYIVSLPYQLEKPIAININSTPAFTRGQLFEFTMNGPGSTDPLIGFQWMDQGTKPLQVPLPFQGPDSQGNSLIFTSDSVADSSVTLQCLVQQMDLSEATITYTIGTPGPLIMDLLAVNKPVTVGSVTAKVGNTKVAVYPPTMTNPQFNQIRISQPGASIRMLGRRRYITVATPTDFIPLESKEAVILMVKAVKLYDEDQYQAAEECEAKGLQWLQEDNAARMLYSIMAMASQQPPTLNLNIYNRDTLIVGDIYEDACNTFGQIGQQNVFDKITTILEILQNMSQWDPQIGYCDLKAFGGPDGNQFYFTLPRYVEEVLALNINGRPTKFQNKWFEFHMNGLGQDDFDGALPIQAGLSSRGPWSNRPWTQIEDMGEVVLAFDPLPINTPFNLVAIAKNSSDLSTSIRAYGTDINHFPIYDTDGSEGFLVPVGTTGSVPPPNPAGTNLVYLERIFRDPTAGFVDLWSATSSGTLIQYLSTYWPDETEPKYRRMRLSIRPLSSAIPGLPRYPLLRIRYRKRWRKVSAFTDPIHLRSRKAIQTAFTAWSLANNNQAQNVNGQGIDMERAGYERAVSYLNDEWRSNHQQEGLGIQIDPDTWAGVNTRETIM